MPSGRGASMSSCSPMMYSHLPLGSSDSASSVPVDLSGTCSRSVAVAPPLLRANTEMFWVTEFESYRNFPSLLTMSQHPAVGDPPGPRLVVVDTRVRFDGLL